MKKYLLFIISMVCAVTGAWADDAYYTKSDGTHLTITTNGDQELNGISVLPSMEQYSIIAVNGAISQEGITKILNAYGTTYDFTFDFSGATIDVSTITNLSIQTGYRVKKYVFSASSLPSVSVLDAVPNAYNTFYAIALDATNNNAYLYVQNGVHLYNSTEQDVTSAFPELTNTYKSGSVYICGNPQNDVITNLSAAGFTVQEYAAPSTDPYTTEECKVTINMANAGTQTFTDLITAAKAKVSGSICTLIVTGEIDETALSALGGTDMTGATRIDLSEATIASGSSIENIALPASLTQLVLPKHQAVSATLKSKFAGATNLAYVYSPTSDAQTKATQFVEDYVWVNQPGGLNQAICCETKLRSAIYVKVESSVALNADDVDLTTNKVVTGYNDQEEPIYSTNYPIKSNTDDATNYGWQFVDFSGANIQQDVCRLSYTKPHSGSYRIIMPDGWSGDQLAIIASLGSDKYGSLAAVYSYTSQGFLQILETDDNSYSPYALQDGRIVRSGTKAIRVVSGTYNETKYGNFGRLSTTTNNLLTAINNACKDDANGNAGTSIEAVTITDVRTATNEPLTFTNKNLIYIQIERIKSAYNDNEGPTLNVDGCKNLGTLNLINSVFASVDASVPALEASGDDPSTTGLTAVNMSGTTVVGTTDLSTSPITNTGFVTTKDTWFKGDLNLSKTALTTFTTTAKVGTTTANTGNIILNENNLTGVSLNQVKFQNESSIIYVRKSADSNSSDYGTLTGSLNAPETIVVPEGFAKTTRIIPYVAASVKEEKYVAPPYVFSATDMRLHEKETGGTNPDKYVYWYTGDMQENKVLTLTTTEGGQLKSLLASDQANVTSSTKLIKVKITGPLASNDLTDLASLNTQILDLSEATLQRKSSDTYTDDVTIFEGENNINQYVKFLLLPAGMTRDDVYNGDTKVSDGIVNKTSLAGFTGLYSAISLTDYNPNNAFDFTSYNKVAGTLQPAVIAAGRGTLNGSQMIRGEEGSERTAYYPTMSGNYNRSATISGLINAYDLSYSTKLDADGHLKFNKRYADESLDADDRTNAGTETNIQGAFSGSNGPRTLDLKAAEITGPEYINDICISYLVPTNYLKYLIIPETESVKETPSYFITHNTVKEICIPSNIEVIRTHFAPSVDHIWTNAATGDITGTRYDNGAFATKEQEATPTDDNYGYTDFTFTGLMPYGTYTFSSNLKMIESNAFANTQPHVKDVYVLATTAPECHVDAFCTAMYVGNSGFSPNVSTGVITRDSYVNGTNWIAMLHYPRECVTPQVQRYTDPTRSYTIASNEVDGKGGVLYYPNYGEFLTAYAQGTTGYLWNAWPRTYEYGMLSNSLTIGNSGWTADWQGQANEKYKTNIMTEGTSNTKFTCTSFYDVTLGGNTKPESLVPYNEVTWNEKELKQNTSGSASTPEYFLYPTANTANESTSDVWNDGAWTWNVNVNDKVTSRDYRGWHQFVLNAFAANTNVPVQPSRSYITESRWYTICLPYDLTWEEMLLFYGSVTASGNTTTVDKTKLPYLCLLSNVVRDEQNTHITLNFSKNLMEYQAGKSADGVWTVSDEKLTDAQKAQKGTNDYVVLHAGVPYLIKPNLTSNPIRQFDIYKADQNLSDYTALSEGRIMVSCAEGGYPGLYEKLKAAENMDAETFCATLQNNMYTVPGLLPLEDDTYPTSNTETYVGQNSTAEVTEIGDKKYYRSSAYDYTFVGSFMMNILPPYCYYLGYKSSTKTTGFYYADYLKLQDGNAIREVYENQMLWVNNQAVICPNLLNTTNGDTDATTASKNKYNLGGHSVGHNGKVTRASGTGVNMRPARWEFFAGSGPITTILPTNDLWTTTQSSTPAPAMMFGNDITGVDNGTTSIRVNGVDVTTTGGNVYSLNGQLVGTSLEGLAKGIYIVNGKKVMVK